jgi:hypothetical protein
MDNEEDVAYVGSSTQFGRKVSVERAGDPEPLRLAEPALTCGYAWGRSGSVPRDVARAILLDATGNEMLAERLCRPFTWEVVSALPPAEFTITRTEVLAWISDRNPIAARRSLASGAEALAGDPVESAWGPAELMPIPAALAGGLHARGAKGPGGDGRQQ